MLRPNNRKYRKSNKGRSNVKVELKSNKLQFGVYGLQALEKGHITARQIEAVRRTITGFTKRKVKI
jgi:large subunit ribosomal protein L16